MDWNAIITAISGNIVALMCLIAWQSERKERMKLQDDITRYMMAVSGYRTDPDSSNVVRIPDEEIDKYDTKILKAEQRK